jgi:hypothetical protein
MANKGFNGSTISIANSAQTPLRNINYNVTAAKVKVTGSGDNSHTYVSGLPDVTVDFEIVGGGGPAEGSSGNCVIAWFDGTNASLTSVFVESRKTSGALDGEILTTVTVVPLGS